MNQDPAIYLEMSTEELCDRADDDDAMARAVIQAKFMNELFKHDPPTPDSPINFTARDVFPGQDEEFYAKFNSCKSSNDEV